MKIKIFLIIISLLSVLVFIVLAEVLLRITGHSPWTYDSRITANEPIMHQPDPDLGWTNKEGKYVFPAYDSSGNEIHMTFTAQGQRLTRPNKTAAKNEFVIVGGSYTQGWAIDDNETYPWKLQKKYSSLNVLNYGTGGYGSYQSLLVMEKVLPHLSSPIFVLYGFIKHHEVRNVAPDKWLEILSKMSRRGHVFVPYATYEENKGLVRHAPEGYLALPLRESLATVAFIEKTYMRMRTQNRILQKRVVTEQILLEMNRITKQYGATFILVLLWANNDTKSHYKSFAQAHDMRNIDCVYPKTREMQVAGEGHPNGKLNSLWAECIAKALDDRMEIQKWSNQGVQLLP